MRHIGHLPDQAQGHRFGDFLVARGIRNEIEAEADGSSLIWIVEEDQLAEAQALLEKFRANPRRRGISRCSRARRQNP